jgi:hypothetical protein
MTDLAGLARKGGVEYLMRIADTEPKTFCTHQARGNCRLLT